MSSSHRWMIAIAAGLAGIVAGASAWVLGDRTPPTVFLIAAGAAPAAVCLAVWARLGGAFPFRAAVGGATIGPFVAIVSHGLVAAFAAAFFLGFADEGRSLLHILRVDPQITAVLASPWVLLALAEYAVVAPITEEAGKFLGSRLHRPTSRRDAFLAGVAAGTGFAIVEDILYATAAVLWGGPWLAVAIVRVTGAAVHPLATGFVALGWWDGATQDGVAGEGRRALRGSLTGAGIHALWNGAIVALLVIETTVGHGGLLPGGGIASIAFVASLGVVIAAALWSVTRSVEDGRDAVGTLRSADVRSLAGWIILSASLLVPAGVLVLAFPTFHP